MTNKTQNTDIEEAVVEFRRQIDGLTSKYGDSERSRGRLESRRYGTRRTNE